LDIEFFHDDVFARLAPAVEVALFRIVEELLTNASRHSQARDVRVKLAQTNGQVHLEIQDRGIGFDPTIAREGWSAAAIARSIRLRARRWFAISARRMALSSTGCGSPWLSWSRATG
jgi:signal transduction histidine kinase